MVHNLGLQLNVALFVRCPLGETFVYTWENWRPKQPNILRHKDFAWTATSVARQLILSPTFETARIRSNESSKQPSKPEFLVTARL